VQLRYFYAAIFGALAAGGGFFFHSEHQLRALRAFCDSIQLKTPDYKLRDLAYEAGYEIASEPFAQLNVTLAHWNPAKGSCRVFLNNDRTVELRRWQEY
jgi:hypothetical protein